MARGFLVSLGNAQLNGGDAIIGNRLTFNTATNLGTGSWTWSGTLANGTAVTNQTANGTFWQGTDGSVYFVPSASNVGTVSSAAATTTPTYAANVFGTAGNDGAINGNGHENIIYGGSSTSPTGTGNDTINAGAGNDTVYGGDGNDVIRGGGNTDTLFGGDGNDTIYGDDQTAPAGSVETLNWTAQGNNTNVAGGFTQDTGNMRVTYAYNDNGAGTGAQTTTTTQYVTGTTAPNNSGLWLQGNGAGPSSTSSLSFDAEAGSNFSDQVANVSFRLNDIDSGNFRDIVTVRAFDLNGNPVAVVLTPSGNDTVSGNTITAGSGGDSASSANGSVLVSIAGPVHYIEIDYENGLSNLQYLYVTNVSFTTLPAADGNDSIDAGAGSDTIYGGGGNDSIQGNAGVDVIYGGAGDDTVDGGSENDVVYGDAGNDSLSGGTGADTMFGGSGNDTISFAEGDAAYGGDGDDTFVLADYNEPANGTITIVGGNGGQTNGDTLKLGKLADITSLNITGTGPNGQTGSVSLVDGTLVNFSEIENIICFTPGTHIATPRGARAIETLRVGDMVVTRDHGLQPIRWIQSRRVPAIGRFAPVRIRPGVLTGLERDLVVSPQHRMLFKGYRAELLFGESEVLVSARNLIDGKSVTQADGGEVTYVHMLFDEHEIIYAEGAATESFHPGDIGLNAVTDAAREELFTLFPDLRSMPKGYGRTARRVLKAHEAGLVR